MSEMRNRKGLLKAWRQKADVAFLLLSNLLIWDKNWQIFTLCKSELSAAWNRRLYKKQLHNLINLYLTTHSCSF